MWYPIMLQLSGRKCLVIGGGNIAERKIDGLLKADALVKVISPQLTPRIQQWVDVGKVVWDGVPWTGHSVDMASYQMVIAATDSTEINRLVYLAAEGSDTLCVNCSEAQKGSVILPTVIRRGKLTISVSTEGSSPRLAMKLRERIGSQYPEAWGEITETLGEIRKASRSIRGNTEERQKMNGDIVEAFWREVVEELNSDAELADKWALWRRKI